MLFEKMSEAFEGLEDRRSRRNRKHPFMSAIGIGLLSTLARYDSFSGMADFAECRSTDLMKLFPLPHGTPSHDTFQRIFDSLNPSAFLECFMHFTEHLATAVK